MHIKMVMLCPGRQVWGMIPDMTDGFSSLATAYQGFVNVGAMLRVESSLS
jgi:hypothetical protein